jgi:hypothetical protein
MKAKFHPTPQEGQRTPEIPQANARDRDGCSAQHEGEAKQHDPFDPEAGDQRAGEEARLSRSE